MVIGIIAVLIAVLVPVLSRARRAGNAVACANNLRNLGHGTQMYANEFRGAIPWEGYAEGDRPTRHVGWWEDPSQWFNAMPKYAGMRQYCDLQADDASGRLPLPRNGNGISSLFVCPEAGDVVAIHKNDLVDDGYLMLWGCKQDYLTSDRRKTYWCYAYNTQLDGGAEDRHTDRRVTLFLHSIPNASETVLLLEKLMRTKEFDPPFMSEIGQGEMGPRGFTTRHNRGGHLLFLDGHVAFFTRKEIVEPPTVPLDFNQHGSVVWNPKGTSQ